MSASIGITLCLIHITLIWMQIKPHDSFKLIWEYISISNAKTACQNTYGTDLASIHSALDQKEVTDLCTNLPSNINPRICWLGATMDGDPCAISWDDQTPYDHTPIFDIGEGCNQGQPRLCIVEDRYGLHDCNEAHNGFPICNYNLPIDCSSATAPVLNCPSDIYVSYESTEPSRTGSATCTPETPESVAISYTDSYNACELHNVITRKWVCTAQCGAIVECSQAITFHGIYCPADAHVNPDDYSPSAAGFATCADPNGDITYSDDYCGYRLGREWWCKFCDGKYETCYQENIYNVPVLSIQCPPGISIWEWELDAYDPDVCSTPFLWGLEFKHEHDEPSVDPQCAAKAIETVTWTCGLHQSGACDKVKEQCTQEITVLKDAHPQIQCPEDDILFQGDSQEVDKTGSAICTDWYSTNPTVTHTDETKNSRTLMGCTNEKTLTRKWMCTVCNGQTASCDQTLKLCEDIVGALRIYNFHKDYGIGSESSYRVMMVFGSGLILLCIATYVWCCIKKTLINRGFEAIPKGIDSDSDNV